MDALRQYLWLWVLAGMIFVSLVISLIFLLINRCLSRRGKQSISQLPGGSDFIPMSNTYQEENFQTKTPHLPPRTQFLTAEARSYENLSEAPNHVKSVGSKQEVQDYEEETHDYEEAHDYKEETHDYEEETHDYEEETHDYEEETHDYEEETHDYEEETHDYEEEAHDYEEETHDYEEETHDYEEETHDYEEESHDYEEETHDYEEETHDYVSVEEETVLPPPPPYVYPAPAADSISYEDYDDVGGEGSLNGEEDYDDVA